MEKSKKRVIISIGITILTIIIFVGILFSASRSVNSPEKMISLGEKYLSELNYGQSLQQFLKVIEIDPMNPRGYIGAAESYIGLGQIDNAIDILKRGLALTEDNDIRSMLEGLTTQPVDPEDSSESGEDISELLSSEQLAFLEPLEAAILAMDYETAFDIQTSPDFLEICRAIPGWEEDESTWGNTDATVYKADNEYEWYIQPNAFGPNGTNHGPEIGVWINGRENGTHIHSFSPRQAIPLHVLINNAEYADGMANGSYKRIYYAHEYFEFSIESGTALNGKKHGQEIIETNSLISPPYSPVISSSDDGMQGDTIQWVSDYDSGRYVVYTGSADMFYLQEQPYQDGSVGYPVCVDRETQGQKGAGYTPQWGLEVVQEIY